MKSAVRNKILSARKESAGLPAGHELRFLQKLDTQLPVRKSKKLYRRMMAVAATFALCIAGYLFLSQSASTDPEIANQSIKKINSLGDVSPELKELENYYLLNVNAGLLDLSTHLNEPAIQQYLTKFKTLDSEYKSLIDDLNTFGVNEPTLQALITNLQLRLDVLYQINEIIKQNNIQNNENELIKL